VAGLRPVATSTSVVAIAAHGSGFVKFFLSDIADSCCVDNAKPLAV
jgi:hypothetical protein